MRNEFYANISRVAYLTIGLSISRVSTTTTAGCPLNYIECIVSIRAMLKLAQRRSTSPANRSIAATTFVITPQSVGK
mgnify:CR=1 FL=1